MKRTLASSARRFLPATTLAAAILTGPAVCAEGGANTPLRLAVELTDGSRIIGTPLTSSVPVRTAYASVHISLEKIAQIGFGAEHKTATLSLTNGDVLAVTFDVDALPMTTLLGDVLIGFQLVRNVRKASDVRNEGRAEDAVVLPPATTVRARHILVSARESAVGERIERRRFAKQIREQLINGADFADMAAKHSDCPSKHTGGDLGTFGRGKMVKPFEDAAFNQKENAIGPVVETAFGYHIIQVTERHLETGRNLNRQ